MALISQRTPEYVVGRGKVYFARMVTGQTPGPFRYIGNTPDFNLGGETEDLDHFSSDEGIREKDDSIALSTTRSGTLTCDDIQMENVALFFFGSVDVVSTTAASGQEETFTSVSPGDVLQLGLTLDNRVGVRGIDNFVLKAASGDPTYALDTDYSLDKDRGMFSILENGSISAKTSVKVEFDIVSSSQTQVISGTTPVEGAVRLLEANPKGSDRDIFIPYAKISPDGDFALKGDEWRTLSFSFEALKPSTGAALYINEKPHYG